MVNCGLQKSKEGFAISFTSVGTIGIGAKGILSGSTSCFSWLLVLDDGP